MRRAIVTFVAAVSGVGVARAEEPRPAEVELGPYAVEFRAGRVELDPTLERLELKDDVEIRVDRYRLLSDELTLQRGPRGVEVEGGGRVAFCPCPDPPLSLEFSSATVAPPTDLLLSQPTLYAGSVPVFWLPGLWLRSADRVGALPPRVAWRGDEGLVAGAGVHVPLSGRESFVDLRAAGYLQGGVDLESRVATPNSTAAIRFDRTDASLLAVDAHGSGVGFHGGAVAYRIDAIRGERGRRATLALEPASRRYDRADLELSRTGGELALGVALRGTAPRGGAMGEFGAVGPAAHIALADGLGARAASALSLSVATVSESRERATSVAIQRLSLRASPVLGPLVIDARVDERAELIGTESDQAQRLTSGAALEAGVPLWRAYGDRRDPLLHEIRPFALTGARVGAARGARLRTPRDYDAARELGLAGIGIASSLGAWGSRDAVTVRVVGGYVGETSAPREQLAAHLLFDARVAATAVETGIDPDGHHTSTLSLRLGAREALHVGAHASARHGPDPNASRALLTGGFAEPELGRYDRTGHAAGGELLVPWHRTVATSVGADWDLEHESPLEVRGAASYRHDCGCLAAVAWGSRREGRGGFDAGVTLDLMP